ASGMASGKTTAYVPQEEPIENATAIHTNMKSAGSSTGGNAPLTASTMKPAVFTSRDTKPNVTARPRMIAPTVTPLQPSTKPSISSRIDMPFSNASTNADNTASPNASAILTVPVRKYGITATPSRVTIGTAKSDTPLR